MEISENTLIKKLRKYEKKGGAVIRGIGDDGAVVDIPGGRYVFVQDVMTEHIHFEFSFLDPYYLGKKALLVNISDLFAMGAKPLYFLVTIGTPDKLSSGHIERLYRGMSRVASQYGLRLIGGDTSSSETFFVDISMIGRLETKTYLGRDKARPGDLIAVSGPLGEAAYGLKLLLEGKALPGSAKYLKRFRDPDLPYALWKELTKRDITEAMMDISDGLIIDLERMMDESGTGARLEMEKIPIPPVLKKNGKEEFAITGGEDYQLLFTFSREKLPAVEELRSEGHGVFVIGEVVKGKGVKVYREGNEIRLSEKGYQHFGGNHE